MSVASIILPAGDAHDFLRDYQVVLLRAMRHKLGDPHIEQLDMRALCEARVHLLLHRAELLPRIVAECAADGMPLDEDIQQAVATLDVRLWIFLKELTHHAVFLDSQTPLTARAVYALTEPLSDIIGGAGAAIEAGVCIYRGRFVCDGLISQLVWIGRRLRSSWQREFMEAKRSGRFLRTPPKEDAVQPELPHTMVESRKKLVARIRRLHAGLPETAPVPRDELD